MNPMIFDGGTARPMTDAEYTAWQAQQAARAAADATAQKQWGTGNANFDARVAWYACNNGKLLNALTDQAAGNSATMQAYLADVETMKRQYPKPA